MKLISTINFLVLAILISLNTNAQLDLSNLSSSDLIPPSTNYQQLDIKEKKYFDNSAELDENLFLILLKRRGDLIQEGEVYDYLNTLLNEFDLSKQEIKDSLENTPGKKDENSLEIIPFRSHKSIQFYHNNKYYVSLKSIWHTNSDDVLKKNLLMGVSKHLRKHIPYYLKENNYSNSYGRSYVKKEYVTSFYNHLFVENNLYNKISREDLDFSFLTSSSRKDIYENDSLTTKLLLSNKIDPRLTIQSIIKYYQSVPLPNESKLDLNFLYKVGPELSEQDLFSKRVVELNLHEQEELLWSFHQQARISKIDSLLIPESTIASSSNVISAQFSRIKDLISIDLIRAQFIDQDYINALYTTLEMLDKYPTNLYFQKARFKAIYAIGFYINSYKHCRMSDNLRRFKFQQYTPKGNLYKLYDYFSQQDPSHIQNTIFQFLRAEKNVLLIRGLNGYSPVEEKLDSLTSRLYDQMIDSYLTVMIEDGGFEISKLREQEIESKKFNNSVDSTILEPTSSNKYNRIKSLKQIADFDKAKLMHKIWSPLYPLLEDSTFVNQVNQIKSKSNLDRESFEEKLISNLDLEYQSNKEEITQKLLEQSFYNRLRYWRESKTFNIFNSKRLFISKFSSLNINKSEISSLQSVSLGQDNNFVEYEKITDKLSKNNIKIITPTIDHTLTRSAHYKNSFLINQWMRESKTSSYSGLIPLLSEEILPISAKYQCQLFASVDKVSYSKDGRKHDHHIIFQLFDINQPGLRHHYVYSEEYSRKVPKFNSYHLKYLFETNTRYFP